MNHAFRKRARTSTLSADEGRRQGRAARSAQAALGSVDEVRAFLNSRHEGLNGRPIDIAIASEAGLIAVEAAIAAAAGRPRPEGEVEARPGSAGRQRSVKGTRT
jgi:uncharacterized protein (DUF2384 family)